MLTNFSITEARTTPSNTSAFTQETHNSIDLTEFWLRRVHAHRFGTFDSLANLHDLRQRVDLFSPELRFCIQPVIEVLDEIFQSSRLSSLKLEPALQESYKRLNKLALTHEHLYC